MDRHFAAGMQDAQKRGDLETYERLSGPPAFSAGRCVSHGKSPQNGAVLEIAA